MVDDKPERIAPGQTAQVILVSTFSGPEHDDRELERVTPVLSARRTGRAPSEL